MPLRDLSHSIESGMPGYPGDDPVVVEPAIRYEDAGVRTTAVTLGSHTGTHVDAPSHMVRDGRTLADFPIEDFRFDARLVDCTDLGERDEITTARVPDARLDVDLLVFHTGWSAHWGTARYIEHPFLSEAAAVAAAEAGFDIALDALNPDQTPSENADSAGRQGHPAHDALFAAGRRIIENLRNLDGLPDEFVLHAYPLPLGGDGAPVRAVAEY